MRLDTELVDNQHLHFFQVVDTVMIIIDVECRRCVVS